MRPRTSPGRVPQTRRVRTRSSRRDRVACSAIGAVLLVSAGGIWPASAVEEELSPARLRYEVVSRRPHDPEAWTQGLVLTDDGRLFESTGLVGRSSLREVDPTTGAVLRLTEPPGSVFGEGLAQVGDRLVQLTWRSGTAFVWDLETFELLGAHAYDGEGWGLCHDGERLVMSDGSARLTFRDPASFTVLGRVVVTLDGEPLDRLNELECDAGLVWANVWATDTIVRIDPSSGRVDGVLEARGLIVPHPTARDPGAVLNGIAADVAAGTWLLTGKRWPELIEVRILDADEGTAVVPGGPTVPDDPTAPGDPPAADEPERPGA
jgi:glutaminyl-peptide cyclotransferase